MTTPAVSVLNLVPVRAGGSTEQALADMVALAQHTEALGYRRYWIAEHHNTTSLASSATSILISHTLQHTQTITVGSGGVMLPNHSPLIVAEQYGTLATLYPGRVDLGLGRAPGTDRLTAQALRRAERETSLDFPEDVATLQRYLGSAEGQGYVKAFPGIGTHIPLYILGSSTESAYLAAEKGLPYVFAAHFAPRMLEQALSIYRSHFRPSESLAQPYAIVALNVIAAADDEEAQYQATTQQQFFLNVVRNSRLPLSPPLESMDGRWNEMERHTVESMTACSLIGGPATLAAQFGELHTRLRADEYMAVSYIYDQALQFESYRLFKQAVEAV
ncbi:LLM class flavin-dependent oxidoreductase [Uruburuella testudinis]|uniref:LLM class flavin-dependent oxidoreductase n=1 Tax=Uruburuella testudinis TaxID=1282863 RepID=A0ABY4DQ10_9NEIS|nr:LLM class flavin-dependent oxidoreductase [Uruburuella testudinis]UOO81137.1 LLM class flavin-dependent oxidoreductase [Uruburuella testudinis]